VILQNSSAIGFYWFTTTSLVHCEIFGIFKIISSAYSVIIGVQPVWDDVIVI